MRRWIVHTKIERALENPASFEICVIREDNQHGQRSYGWFDSTKLLISHNGGPCRWPLTQKVLDKLLIVAEQIAAEVNAEESTILGEALRANKFHHMMP